MYFIKVFLWFESSSYVDENKKTDLELKQYLDFYHQNNQIPQLFWDKWSIKHEIKKLKL